MMQAWARQVADDCRLVTTYIYDHAGDDSVV